MKNKKLVILKSTLGMLGTSIIGISLGLTLSTCTTTKMYDKSITKELYSQYNKEFNEALGQQGFYQLTKENQPKVISVIKKYIDKIQSISESVKNDNNFGLDPSIWLGSFLYTLKTKLKLIESNIRYIIVNSNDQMIMTNYSKYFQNIVAKEAKNWPKNENGIVLIDEKINSLNNVKQYINNVFSNLKEGLENGVTWSGILTKHTIGSMLQILYSNELEIFAKQDTNTLNLSKGSLFTSNNEYIKFINDNKISQDKRNNIKIIVEEVQNSIDKLMNFLITDYYKGINYGKSEEEKDLIKFEVLTTNPNEEDNGFSVKYLNNIKYIKGLGLNNKDLEVKDIGIGFSGNQGQNIYKALLQKHSNIIDADPKQQFKFGNDQVQDILIAMKEVANKIADIKINKNSTNEWKETFMYDEDSSGNTYGSIEKKDIVIRDSSGSINIRNFFMWLNSDQFFNGRDMKENQFVADELGNKYNNANTYIDQQIPYKYKSYKVGNIDLVSNIIGTKNDKEQTKTWGDAGNLYDKYIIKKLSPATIQSSNTITNEQMTNSISPEAAYVGASRAVFQYLTYKKDTSDHISGAFKKTPVDWTLRSGTGGAAYASSGIGSDSWQNEGWGGFYLDVNPYFGLQKWSMSTLTNHEAVSGHVFQFNYAKHNPSDKDAISFSTTAYSEGWGLFSEWLATQMGIYGEPIKLASSTNINGIWSYNDVLTLPKFGVNSKTTNISILSDYANDVYKIGDSNNQTYYDALQYFGFLNERQLRAMRVTVDVGLHAGKNGEFVSNTGYSLKQARDYLSSNSGLGIDDIKRESKRYLEYTGQATSYYNGLIEMQNYFLKAKNIFDKKYPNKIFMDWQNPSKTRQNTEGLFDLILRNGSIPMPVLTWAVDKYLSI